MSKIIEIVVSPSGQSTVATKGFIGGEYRDASGFLELALRPGVLAVTIASILVLNSCSDKPGATSRGGRDDDARKLEGAWTAVACEEKGKEGDLTDLTGQERNCFFAGDRVKLLHGEGTYVLDARANPKQIDVKVDEGQDKGKTLRGLYALEGDALTICFSRSGAERPKELKTAKESRSVLMTYKRVVHEGEPDAVAKNVQALEGAWAVVASERDGRSTPTERAMRWKITFHGGAVKLELGEEKEEGAFRLDVSKRPRTIDVVASETVLGVYELDGDTLKYCWQKGGKGRPGTFTTKPGSEQVMMVLKRSGP